MRFAGDKVGVEHFVGGQGTVAFLGVSTGVSAESSRQDPPRGAGVHRHAGDGPHPPSSRPRESASARTTWMWRRSLSSYFGAAVEQHHDGVDLYSRRTTGEPRRRLVTEACELLHRTGARSASSGWAGRWVLVPPLFRVLPRDHRDSDPAVHKQLHMQYTLRQLGDGERRSPPPSPWPAASPTTAT